MTELRIHRVLPLLGALLLPVLAGLLPGRSADTEASPRDRGAKADSGVVIEQGVLEAVRCMSVKTRTRGQITWTCPEGTTGEKGERVLELNHESRLRSLDNREVALEEARARVTPPEDAFAEQQKDLEQEVKTAESTLALARLNLKILREGPTPGARAQARAVIRERTPGGLAPERLTVTMAACTICPVPESSPPRTGAWWWRPNRTRRAGPALARRSSSSAGPTGTPFMPSCATAGTPRTTPRT